MTFDRDGKRFGVPLPLSDNTIENVQPCGNGIAVAAADPPLAWSTGKARSACGRPALRPICVASSATLSRSPPDAKAGPLRAWRGRTDPVLFDLGQATVTSAPEAVPGLHRAVDRRITCQRLAERYQPNLCRQADRNRTVRNGSRSLAIRPDHKGFVAWLGFLAPRLRCRWQAALGAGRPGRRLGRQHFS